MCNARYDILIHDILILSIPLVSTISLADLTSRVYRGVDAHSHRWSAGCRVYRGVDAHSHKWSAGRRVYAG